MKAKKFLNFLCDKLINIFPKNNFGDKVFSLINFFRSHRRLPNSQKLISNYLFSIKHSSEGYNPLRAYVSDKAFVKDYVRGKVGDKFNVPTHAVIHSFEEAKTYDFPKRCCIKPTHLSGVVIFREDAKSIDFELIRKWFNTNYYEIGREKNYRYLKPKLIVEPLIFDSMNNEDYKFFCYRGKAKFVQVDIDRYIKHTRLYFNRAWEEQEFSILKPKSNKALKKPKNLDAMLEIADTLCADFEFIRVDLYTDGNQIYVGELTNWPENGNGNFVPKYSEYSASSLLFSED